MSSQFDFQVIADNWRYLLIDGLGFTIQLTIASMAGGLILGTVIALGRLSSNKAISRCAWAYVSIVRSIPLLLVIFWFYFLSPYLLAWLAGASQPVKVGPLLSSLITFTLFEACYYSEIMRAGIMSVPTGQRAAAEALGLSKFQIYRSVIFPQAIRNMLPLFLTQTVILFQDVSLVYVLSITDFVGAASKLAQRDNRLVELYLFVALVYLLICSAASLGIRKLQASK
ncbi:amino acid ABC transporter permease [Polaromonas sp. P1(28)-8]|nr:amino acid ABC transporter permease [Polaromonas sp. P1(28)-8]